MAREPGDRSSPSSASSGDEQDDDTTMKQEDDKAPKDLSASSQNAEQKKPSALTKSKDPSRPKRKKARRACFACQRAHLTCGDERPCQRCVKRGLTETCQDGARKKAKYLHDTPAEALIPGNIAKFSHPHAMKQNPAPTPNHTASDSGVNALSGSNYVPQAPAFNHAFQHPARPPSIPETPAFGQYARSNQSPISSQYSASQQTSPVSGVPNPVLPQHTPSSQGGHALGETSLFDHNDTSMFSFDLASMNFGNHYGAMEFGMLGHLAGGSNDPALLAQPRPPSSSAGGFDEFGQAFNETKPEFTYANDPAWPAARTNVLQQQYPHLTAEDRRNSQGGPHAFAIGAGPGSLSGASPSSAEADMMSYDPHGNLVQAPSSMYPSRDPLGHAAQQPSPISSRQPAQQQRERSRHQKVPSQPPIGAADERGAQPSESISKKLIEMNAILPPVHKSRRNTTSVYSSITKPYPYTAAFHALTAVLRKRFPTPKRLRIAQALATVRPSFISCSRTLVDDDLIFMEKCFQRGLWDYDDFQHDVCTPTIVCRRTGEVAHVTKEFCIMSGWTRDVLLGRKPNRNANVTTVESMSSTSSKGVNTPSNGERKTGSGAEGGNAEDENPRPQPVFLAELLDEDSVVRFYEDYAKLAFADHKGSVSSRCQVVKYMTKEDLSTRKHRAGEHEPGELNSRGGGISGENAMRHLGAREGRVNCVFCWEVKRDVFNMPMFMIFNFLPIV